MGWKTKEQANEYQREYRKKNPEKIKKWDKKRIRNTPEGMRKFLDWQKKRRIEYTKKILEIKIKQKGCKYCGWNRHPEILQFHHRDKSQKKFKFSVGNLGNYKWETILKEIKKCDIICPNCHFWLHFQETAYKFNPPAAIK